MKDPATSDPLLLCVGGMARAELMQALEASGVQLNRYAVALLGDAAFDSTETETVEIVECTVGGLGLTEGAALSRILATAQDRGLRLCPPTTGPYLRLVMSDQKAAPDSVMSNGRAPSGAVTVAAAPLRDDDDYPKGFYLRVVDGVPWLRGYVCSDEHTWSPEDRFAFRLRRGQ